MPSSVGKSRLGLEPSITIIGAVGWAFRIFRIANSICVWASSLLVFLWQSITYIAASICANKSCKAGSNFPLPEKPKLMTSTPNFLPKIDGYAMPALDAQAP